MEYRVYKSLDRKASTFGLRGSYLKFGLIGVAVAFVIGGLFWINTSGLVGFIVFVALVLLAYAAIMGFQARFSERERNRWFAGFFLPDSTAVPPRRLSSYVRHGDTVKTEAAAQTDMTAFIGSDY